MKHKINHLEYKDILVPVVRARRKTIALIIHRDGKMLVRAPLPVSDATIFDFLGAKELWWRKRLAVILQRQSQYTPKQFREGDTFLFLGQRYSLVLSDIKNIAIDASALQFPHKYLSRARIKMTQWYKREALRILHEKGQYYAPIIGVQYKNLSVGSARSRWGSCSNRGDLRFAWHLVMAPHEVIDYVVVHELAHIREHNHSSRFWSIVASIVPNFQNQKLWLQENGHLLRID